MSFKQITALSVIALMLASCAAGTVRQEEGKTAAATKPAAEEPFSLPDSGPQKAAKEATKEATKAAPKKPADMEAVLIEDTGQEQFIILNFDNTDIGTILATFGELLGINYILTPGVSGNVTIQSYSRVPVKNLFHIFQSILEVNGLTAIKDGDFYRIVPIDTAKTQPLDVQAGAEVDYPLDPSFVTKLIALENVQASEVSGILRELMPRGANLIVYEPSNLLIVTALPRTIEKLMKIVEALDMDEMDSGSIRTFVYYVENGEAKKLEEILKTVYINKSTTSGKTAAKPSTARTVPSASSATGGGALPGDLGEITISAYEDINALLIKCSPRSYLALLKVLKNIDVAPRQVLIEVLIAEVTLGEETSYGIEWMMKFKSGNIVGFNPGRFLSSTGDIASTGEVGNGAPAGQFTAVSSGTMNQSSWIGLFTAIASENDLDVLATPNILAMDNKEAEIKIGNEVPTATSTTQSTEGITTSSQIQYKTVGTILTVTPHITEKGNVSMKIVVEKSDIGASTIIGSGEYPSFITRRATTNALVNNGHTLFLGGLISNKKSTTKSGIPFLSKIPILGYFFGGQKWTNSKTEMFVMVTPFVISSPEEADKLTHSFDQRVKVIKERIFKIREEKEKGDTTGKSAAGSIEDKTVSGTSPATGTEGNPPAPYIP